MGSCGYTDITPAGPRLSMAKELYAAAADANADFAGSCGRCYEVCFRYPFVTGKPCAMMLVCTAPLQTRNPAVTALQATATQTNLVI